ncbi:protein canopy homolog 2-like [Pomacea canaliculata]|uniref:protein canopy homolog 2-like n=1 Tax=Pomacea canaliculata TaxID=400727 RepID=UPI000D72EB2B|nr:protein canopy homolog 2-like [Pomacea canaliculata]XP_025077824.1 protein canopy homolog 2-like [Pomacea canaliculata]XP_025077825.1 protein canopy homolog 2-like [Pomacea canaliculata]
MKQSPVFAVFRMFLLGLTILVQVSARKDEALFCAVCRALVEEVNVKIENADPDKTIKVGSFRVDSKGNQKLADVKYARSDLHLTEIFDSVCETMSDYIVILEDDGTHSVVRRRDSSGIPLSLRNIKYISDKEALLQFYCDTIVEEYEDQLVSLFTEENTSTIQKTVCVDETRACTEQQLSRPLQRLPPEDGDSYSKKGEDSVGDKNADLTLPTENSDTTEAQEENDLKSEL